MRRWIWLGALAIAAATAWSGVAGAQTTLKAIAFIPKNDPVLAMANSWVNEVNSKLSGKVRINYVGGPEVITLSRAVSLTPPNEAQIIAKFRANTVACPQAACDALLRALLDEMPRCRELMRLATAAIAAPDGAGARP